MTRIARRFIATLDTEATLFITGMALVAFVLLLLGVAGK
jgi:Na+-transporting methylmalonyl-CoA/oxaloacetate decarboxylase gamma subunit